MEVCAKHCFCASWVCTLSFQKCRVRKVGNCSPNVSWLLPLAEYFPVDESLGGVLALWISVFFHYNKATKTSGLRPMERKDIKAVQELINNYLKQFNLAPVMDEEEVAHWFLPQDHIIDTFVVEVRERPLPASFSYGNPFHLATFPQLFSF